MSDDPRTIVFLCQYGGAKSVMAAAFFNRLAGAHALPYRATAVAAETPYAAVPEPVVTLLAREDVDVQSFEPRNAGAGEMQSASRVVSIDCPLDAESLPGITVERWDDVPLVSVDLAAAAGAIRKHVDALIEELRERG